MDSGIIVSIYRADSVSQRIFLQFLLVCYDCLLLYFCVCNVWVHTIWVLYLSEWTNRRLKKIKEQLAICTTHPVAAIEKEIVNSDGDNLRDD